MRRVLAWTLYGIGHLVDRLLVPHEMSRRTEFFGEVYQRVMSLAHNVSPGTIWPDRRANRR